jgi:hypothetical protein
LQALLVRGRNIFRQLRHFLDHTISDVAPATGGGRGAGDRAGESRQSDWTLSLPHGCVRARIKPMGGGWE